MRLALENVMQNDEDLVDMILLCLQAASPFTQTFFRYAIVGVFKVSSIIVQPIVKSKTPTCTIPKYQSQILIKC